MRSLSGGIRRVFAAAVGAALFFWGVVFADDVVVGRVPFVVNVDARVAITPPAGLADASGVTANVAAGADTVLAIVLAGGTSPVRRGAHTTRAAAPVAVYYSRGNLSLTLSPRALGSADAALYTVTGKRVLHGRAPPPPNSRNISRNNVAAGVYLLSVKGVDGQTYNTRLSHTGGRLNVNIGFYDGGLTEPPSPQAAAAALSDYGEWGVAVSAAGYEDSTYTFAPVAGDNAEHIITLLPSSDGGGDSYTETAGGLNFKMIAVEGGTFTMGCTAEQGSDCYSAESPTSSVTLSTFYIGEFEVTQGLWQAVMGGANPSSFSGCDNCPVESVSWNDIVNNFIPALNSLTGKTYRLPTEAEWEYAARGGKNSQGYKYSGSNDINEVAWYSSNSGSKTQPVGTKAPNELGIYDMSGNVWEWVSDWYGSYSSGAKTNPQGPTSGFSRVVRGGSWNNGAWSARVSGFRIDEYPTYRNHNIGFRLVSVSP